MLPPKLRQLFPYALVVFLGYVGFSLPLPVLPEIFLDSRRSILPSSFSIEMKTIMLGLVLAAYPGGQLLGSPLLGVLSDRWGRKKVILGSLAMTAIGYAMTALATTAHAVGWIFFGLFICGFSEGNVAIAQAVIGDISGKEEKVAHFGWINLFTCVAFIIGPLLGGWLADPAHHHGFDFATPFWLGAILASGALVLVWRFARETKIHTSTQLRLLQGLRFSWNHPLLKKFYLANFFLYFGIYSFWNCLAIYLEREFDFSTSELAYVMAYNSFFFALGLLCLVAPLARRSQPDRLTGTGAWGLALLLIAIVIPSSRWGIVATVPLIGMLLSILMTNAAVMVSNAADDKMQGQAMGNLQSVQVLAGVFVGLTGGVMAAAHPALPLVIGAAMATVCGFLLRRR